MIISRRDDYLKELLRKQWNGRIKIITGIRRCGKSTLLLKLFRGHLLESGVSPDQMITVELDSDIHEACREPAELSRYIREKITDRN